MNYYADIASEQIKKGRNLDSIANSTSSKVIFIQSKLESKLNTFIDNAKVKALQGENVRKLF